MFSYKTKIQKNKRIFIINRISYENKFNGGITKKQKVNGS